MTQPVPWVKNSSYEYVSLFFNFFNVICHSAGSERSEEAIFGVQLHLSGDVSHQGGEGDRVQPNDGHYQQANL